MAKPNRQLQPVANAQQKIESETDKFKQTESLAHDRQVKTSTAARISPQISCTVLPEDKQLLNELTIFAINKAGKPLNTSSIIRALIRLGHKRKEELEF
jgi:hypothetical protein